MKSQRQHKADWIWAAAVGLLLLLQFWWLPGAPESAGDSYSNAADGKLGFYRVLSRLLSNVRRESQQLIPGDARTLVAIGPDRHPNDYEKRQILDFVSRGGSFVFAPNWTESEFSMRELGFELDYRSADSSDDDSSEKRAKENRKKSDDDQKPSKKRRKDATPDDQSADDEASLFDFVDRVTAVSKLVDGEFSWRSNAKLKLVNRFDHQPLVESKDGVVEVAGWFVGDGYVIACSSPDIFSNRSMVDEVKSELAVRLVEQADQNSFFEFQFGGFAIIINESLNASDSYRYTGILLSPQLRSGTLQLMLVAILCAWFGFHRFGPARRNESIQRKNLTASAEAVGNLQFHSSDRGRVVGSYMEYIDSHLRKTYGPTVGLTHHEVLASRTGLPVDEVRSQLSRAEELVRGSRVSSSQTAGAIRWLAQFHRRLFNRPSRN